MDSAISFTELLDYTEHENKRWKEWFLAHPAALEVPCDIANVGTVGKLLLHIFANHLFFAHRLLDMHIPDWKDWASRVLPKDWASRALSVDELFQIADEGCIQLRSFITNAQTPNWQQVIELGFQNLRASKRKMMAQTLLHGIHHRGQLATLLRQHGFDGLWVHDLILTEVMN